MTYDLVVVGGGIVGLATAMELLGRWPPLRLLLLEKEPQLASHQTSHNSGVLHSGIYYRPGSLKARTCVAGAKLMVEFCRAHGIPHELCGKVIVATDEAELPRLRSLLERGIANGVAGLSMLGPEGLRELEPHARGIAALHVPGAGLVNYRAVAEAMAELVRRRGGQIHTGARVTRLARQPGAWRIETTAGEMAAPHLIHCAGLQADRLTVMAGGPRDVRIIPFRGEYFELIPSRRGLVRNMIYPVPDPALPFLGVHFTRAIDGSIHAGPNAVLALKREGYRKQDISAADLGSLLTHPGFWRMTRRFWRTGMAELHRSLSKPAFVRSLQRLVPEVRAEDLVPAPGGVRAQAVNLEGALVDDFDLLAGQDAIHVRNVPSPAATASIRIGQMIADLAGSAFALAPPALAELPSATHAQ